LTEEEPVSDPNPRQTSLVALVLAWGFVGIPLLWGVAMALANAVKLFR
jgi:hypothetical protein